MIFSLTTAKPDNFRRGLLVASAIWVLGTGTGNAAMCLVVLAESPEREVAALPLGRETAIHLDFINSIYLAPVRETFVYDPAEGLCLTQIETPSAGVFEYYGLVPDPSGRIRMQRRLGPIRLLSHDYQNHWLTVGERRLHLKGLVEDGRPLVLTVRTEGECGP
jgi:hypothetical protein